MYFSSDSTPEVPGDLAAGATNHSVDARLFGYWWWSKFFWFGFFVVQNPIYPDLRDEVPCRIALLQLALSIAGTTQIDCNSGEDRSQMAHGDKTDLTGSQSGMVTTCYHPGVVFFCCFLVLTREPGFELGASLPLQSQICPQKMQKGCLKSWRNRDRNQNIRKHPHLPLTHPQPSRTKRKPKHHKTFQKTKEKECIDHPTENVIKSTKQKKTLRRRQLTLHLSKDLWGDLLGVVRRDDDHPHLGGPLASFFLRKKMSQLSGKRISRPVSLDFFLKGKWPSYCLVLEVKDPHKNRKGCVFSSFEVEMTQKVWCMILPLRLQGFLISSLGVLGRWPCYCRSWRRWV